MHAHNNIISVQVNLQLRGHMCQYFIVDILLFAMPLLDFTAMSIGGCWNMEFIYAFVYDCMVYVYIVGSERGILVFFSSSFFSHADENAFLRAYLWYVCVYV